MGVNPVRKADLISVRDMPKVIDAAVKAAHARLGKPVPGPFIKKWEIYGYVIRDKGLAESFSTAVAAEISKSGVGVEPAVLTIGKDILCGFVERPNLPQERSF
jgi:hypothetical protein